MAEFTGERAIPGQIEPDLWNEHLARYAFALRHAAGRRVLDAGCGVGYGADMLAAAAEQVAAVDVAAEAIAYARAHYRRPNLVFVQASCTALPFADGTFDLVTAFEVIEHVQDWAACLAELRRVLAPHGTCFISTPNRTYYSLSRRQSGPNPYHYREFDRQELTAELARFFPAVRLFVENHLPGIAILPSEPGPAIEAVLDQPCPDPDQGHFLLAVCSLDPRPQPSGLWWAPRAANVLWERERHIEALEKELAQKDGWLEEARREKQELLEMFRSQTAELERSNRWAASLDEQLAAARQRIVALQQELAEQQEAGRRMAAGYEAKIAELDEELRRRAERALELERLLEAAQGELAQRVAELAECVRLLDKAEATVVERTQWAQQLEARVRALEARLAAFRASRWVRLGRLAGLGPRWGDEA